VFDEPVELSQLDKLLKPVETSSGSVTLEVYHLRVPVDRADAAVSVWDHLDEQFLSPAVRRDLVANGFRAGVVGGALPDELAELIGLEGEAVAPSPERLITDRTASPRVRRRVVQLNRHEQIPIQASDLYPDLQVLIGGTGGLRGTSYTQARAVYALRAEAVQGQQVAVRVMPELHHGELRNRYAGSDEGIFLMTPSREREAFESLQVETELMPGEVLVLGSVEDAGSSLGHAFHRSQETGPAEEKLILVRVLQVPRTEILSQ
jgi:hypothetical protein